jgi:hypothetical protein
VSAVTLPALRTTGADGTAGQSQVALPSLTATGTAHLFVTATSAAPLPAITHTGTGSTQGGGGVSPRDLHVTVTVRPARYTVEVQPA